MIVYKYRKDGVYFGETMEIEGNEFPSYTTSTKPPETLENEYAQICVGVWNVFEKPVPNFIDEEQKIINKQKAIYLLSQTDWSEVPSVSNAEIHPHLVNVSDFITYRTSLRIIALNPPDTEIDWPSPPEEIWSSE